MTSELKALTRNADVLVQENDKLTNVNNDLLERIAILESSLRNEKTFSAALSRQHEADFKLIKSKDEEIKLQAAEIARLKRYEDRVVELKLSLENLEKQDWSAYHNLDLPYSPNTKKILLEERVAEYGKTAHAGLLIPVYLQPLTDAIKADVIFNAQ